MQPFRARRLEYVKSELRETANGEAYYHVTLEEPADSPPIGWLEKSVGRDFGIGANIGAVAALVATTLGGAGMGLIAAGFVACGAVIGGTSDYIRNSNELLHGVDIHPPSYFNRDMILNGLGWATNLGIVASLGLAGAALAIGAPVAAPIALAVNYGLMGAGTLYGGVMGAQDGFHRIETEYAAAERKYKDPSYKVSLLQKRETQWDELISNEASVAATVVPMLAGLAQTESSAPLPSPFHTARPMTSFQTSESLHVRPQPVPAQEHSVV